MSVLFVSPFEKEDAIFTVFGRLELELEWCERKTLLPGWWLELEGCERETL